MKKKSFFLGVLAGVVLTFVVLVVISLFTQKTEEDPIKENDPIQYFEEPISYENKTETSFQVFQVLGNTALAIEASDEIGGEVLFGGNTVLILGENFYSDQVITIKNPQRVGKYSYTSKGGMPMTVPVIQGEFVSE